MSARARHAWLDALPLLAAAGLVLPLASTWARRLPYPYDLEWMEGGVLAHAWRLTRGLSLYVEPGPDFIPMIYPPGYPWAVAALGEWLGLGYAAARGLSLAGSLAAAGALVFVVGRYGASWRIGLASAAVFLGCYGASGAFYDLVRPDGLGLGLLAWAVALGLGSRRGGLRAAGLLLAAAFLVKQSAAVFGVPLALGLWARAGPRRALEFAAWATLPALAGTAWLQWSSDGWFLRYLAEVPRSHPFVWRRAAWDAPREIGAILPVALAGAALWLAGPGWRGRAHGGRAVTGAAVVVTALALAGAMRAHQGGFVNVWMPAHWAVALAFGVAAARWRAPPVPARPGTESRRAALVCALLCAQLGWQAVSLGLLRPGLGRGGAGWGFAGSALERLVPTERDRRAGDRVVAALAGYRGPVLSPVAPWLPVAAGFAPSFHLYALRDVAQYPGGPLRREALAAIVGAAARHHWGAVLDGERPMRFGVSGEGGAYRIDRALPAEPDAGWPRTGWRARPAAILVPDAQGPAARR